MKRCFGLFAFLSLLPLLMNSQTYELTVSTATYVNLANGTPAVTTTWDDPAFDVPIGFTFQFFGQPITTLHQFAAVAYPLPGTGNGGDTSGLFLTFGADLIDRGFADTLLLSPITYKTTGPVGHRICTIEWKNAGFYKQYFFFGENSYFVNFQMRLYEENGDIVYHFGPSLIDQPDLVYDGTGPFVGLLENLVLSSDISLGENLLLTGNPANPTVIQSYTNVYLNGNIPPNTVYTFSRQVSGLYDPIVTSTTPFFSPNPCKDFLYLIPQVKEELIPPIYIYNATGSLVKKEEQPDIISTEGWMPGMYQLQFQTKDGLRSQRIAVIH